MQIAQCPFVNVDVKLAQLGFEPMVRVRVCPRACACACVMSHIVCISPTYLILLCVRSLFILFLGNQSLMMIMRKRYDFNAKYKYIKEI